MGFTNPSQPGGPGRSGTIRRRSVIALAAAFLFISLFIDVGVARAAYPAGWVDPDFGKIGSCVIMCGGFFTAKGPIAKYGLGAGCIDCAFDLFGEINDWMLAEDPGNCYTGVLGQPCGGREYTSF